MPITSEHFNKFRAAVDVLQKGREMVVDAIADDVLDQADDLLDGGYQLHEFLETQGTRLHFLSLLISQLEMSADTLEETLPAPPPPPKAARKRKPRAKKITQQPSAEITPDD